MPQPNLNSEDYYEILGCPKNASEADLKKAYRKLAVKVCLAVAIRILITVSVVLFHKSRRINVSLHLPIYFTVAS